MFTREEKEENSRRQHVHKHQNVVQNQEQKQQQHIQAPANHFYTAPAIYDPPRRHHPHPRSQVCKYYLRSSCRFGRRCWNWHPPPSSPATTETMLRAMQQLERRMEGMIRRLEEKLLGNGIKEMERRKKSKKRKMKEEEEKENGKRREWMKK